MRYDLGSYLARKRISLAEFAAANNIKTVNDIGMFILNNKTFDISDETVQQLSALFPVQESLAPEDMEIISPRITGDDDSDPSVVAPTKETSGRKGKKTTVSHSSSVANLS
jgi:hypothetical protein